MSKARGILWFTVIVLFNLVASLQLSCQEMLVLKASFERDTILGIPLENFNVSIDSVNLITCRQLDIGSATISKDMRSIEYGPDDFFFRYLHDDFVPGIILGLGQSYFNFNGIRPAVQFREPEIIETFSFLNDTTCILLSSINAWLFDYDQDLFRTNPTEMSLPRTLIIPLIL